MKKTRIIVIGSITVVLFIFVFMYMFYFSTPKAFPNDEMIIGSIFELFPEAEANTIQDVIYLNERNVFVPFISRDNNYGVSYWIWDKYQWELAKIETSGEPKIWMINESDPSTYHIVWNINPKDKLSVIDYYFIRDRGYFISSGVHTYTPKVQMKTTITIEDQSYGVIPFQQEWIEFIESFIAVEKGKQPKSNFFQMFPQQQFYVGWFPFDQFGEAAFPENSVNGSGYIKRNIKSEFVRILNRSDLELP